MKNNRACKVNNTKDIYNEVNSFMYCMPFYQDTRIIYHEGRKGKNQNMENYKNAKTAPLKYILVQSGIFAIRKFCKNSCVQSAH